MPLLRICEPKLFQLEPNQIMERLKDGTRRELTLYRLLQDLTAEEMFSSQKFR